ncbi:hypothetical protein, partial [Parazoarcus communis]|uniref:hypothetical protein n=1 Tax=Parazoarcus communis TaxID=41977 RepID=UPI001B7D26DB
NLAGEGQTLGGECVRVLPAEAFWHRSFPCRNYIKIYLIAGLIKFLRGRKASGDNTKADSEKFQTVQKP